MEKMLSGTSNAVVHDIVDRLGGLANLEREGKHPEAVNVLQSAILLLETTPEFIDEEAAMKKESKTKAR